MDFKKVTIISGECLASVDLTSSNDMVTLAVSELEVDQNKSTNETTYHKTVSTTEIYLGPEEVLTLIDALKFINTKDEF